MVLYLLKFIIGRQWCDSRFSSLRESLFFSVVLHLKKNNKKNFCMQTSPFTWISLARHWLLRSCGFLSKSDLSDLPDLVSQCKWSKNRQGHKFSVQTPSFKASSEFGLHTIFTVAWKVQPVIFMWLTVEDCFQTFRTFSVCLWGWIVTVGEFTALSPEFCIAGEDGRGESNLRHLFLLIGWLS